MVDINCVIDFIHFFVYTLLISVSGNTLLYLYYLRPPVEGAPWSLQTVGAWVSFLSSLCVFFTVGYLLSSGCAIRICSPWDEGLMLPESLTIAQDSPLLPALQGHSMGIFTRVFPFWVPPQFCKHTIIWLGLLPPSWSICRFGTNVHLDLTGIAPPVCKNLFPGLWEVSPLHYLLCTNM